jgi:Holliday junction resolvase-like predicted endonuclease
MTILVTKYDGTKQPFSKQKIVKTCIRMGATPEQAKEIADQIENKLYNGIPTRRILQMIYNRLKKHKPKMKLQTDLRRSLSLLRSAPDFERYVQLLLKEHGYDVMPNQIIQGRCVTHEVDAIATKNNKTCFVEVKHHFKYHTPTSLDVSRIARAVYEDVTEGYTLGKNNLKIDYAMIVCNTKLSEHAKKYANCRNIQHIAWSTATNQDLQTLIETKKLYPVTFLKQVNTNTRDRLTANGIVMLKQLTQQSITELKAKTALSTDKLASIIEAARTILS